MKKEIIILLAVIVALSTYLVLRPTDGTHYTLPELKKVAIEDVDRVEIKTGSETLLIEKRGDTWAVDLEGFPAKQEEVKKCLKNAVELSLTALVSEAKSYSRYDLAPDKAKTLSLFKGETLLRTIAIGKAAPSRSHTFVTVNKDQNVYQAQGNFSNQVTTDPERYIDKALFTFKPADVVALSIVRGEKKLSLARTSTTPEEAGDTAAWKDAEGTEADGKTVTQLLSALSALSCDTWLVKRPEGRAPSLTLTVTTDRPHTLALFGNGPMQGTVTDKAFGFALSETLSGTLNEKADTLLGDPAPEMDQAGVN